MQSFREFINQKYVRLGLAVFCLCMVMYSLDIFLNYKNQADFLRGIGGVVLWGGWTAVNFMHPFGRTVPRVNFIINVGIALLVASWFVV
jgi:hypothetical protein